MLRISFKNKKQTKNIIAVSLLIFFLNPLLVKSVFANAVITHSYTIQFNNDHENNYGNLKQLSRVASSIKHKFIFTSNTNFQNIYTFDSTLSLDSIQTSLTGYKYLEPNNNVATTTYTDIVTNDPGFTLNPLDIDKQWGLAKAGFTKAWSQSTGDPGTIVAIIDTGIDQTHEDLQQTKFIGGFDFLQHNEIGLGTNTDDNGHGTLITGVLAATPNNGVGIVGTNWQISIMPVKALDDTGAGSASDIAEAIVWATDHGAKIINLSLGGIGFGHDTTLANSISYAYKKNVVVVAAVGNDVAITGGNLDEEPVFPVCDDNGQNMVLGVGATDQNDRKPEFSNFGKNCLDVTAPGKRILSTINHDPVTKKSIPNAYAYASGTSLAVPLVSGQAALIKAVYPAATNRQIRDQIIATADNIDSINVSQCSGHSCKGLLGAGRINVIKSLEQPIPTPTIQEGDVVQVEENQAMYYIIGGKRHIISSFVKNQRFADKIATIVTASELEKFTEGPYTEPLDGTLFKLGDNTTVYYMSRGLKLPITAQVFGLWKFKFSDVVTLTYSEVNSWLTGNFLTPPDGALVRTAKNHTVYWVISGVLHPINAGFYKEKGLNIFPVVYISEADLKSFSKGEAYIR